ncbi:MAG: hypothetical protein R6V83_10995 [Candidatus Thorarchaeota archaeon]
MIHSWAFARITKSLKHNLEQLGWPVEGKDARFQVVPENWTSIMYWECGNKGRRPRQDRFTVRAVATGAMQTGTGLSTS